MYVLAAIDEDQRPILIQADSLESLNEKVTTEFGDWEEFSYWCNSELGYCPEDAFSLWKLENGALVQQSFVIHTRPTIIL